MKKKKILAIALAAAMSLSMAATSAYAAREDGGGQGGGPGGGQGGEGGRPGGGDAGITYSSDIVTVPGSLEDGVYVGDAKVEPDEDDGFNHYPISVAVTVKDGAIVSFLVSGAESSNTQYSKNAETGINKQLAGSAAGEYKVDAVTMATCSSKGIVQAINKALQSEPTGTSLSLGPAIYHKAGTTFELTITDPKEGKDYSEIVVSHALGKFANPLEAEAYKVELKSTSASEIVYEITILPTAFSIEDDDITHTGSYNTMGATFDVTVAGSSAGRATITPSSTVQMDGNTLVLTGGNGETLEDYIANIGNVKISYVDENGETVETAYTTSWQHDIEPEFVGSDFFNPDGSVNFNLSPFVNGAEGTYAITVESSGYDALTAEIGGVVNQKPDANGGNADSNTGNGSDDGNGVDSDKASQDADDNAPKTGDDTPLAMGAGLLGLAAAGICTALAGRRRNM